MCIRDSESAVVTIAAGEEAPLEDLAQRLTRAGYERCIQVEGTGQFSVRGGILDVFPPQAEHPYRVEFWDDEIDSIATFDVGSQRRLEQVERVRCLPCMETLPHLAPGGAAGLAKAVLGTLSTRCLLYTSSRASMCSLSTRFLAQPSEMSPIFGMVFSSFVHKYAMILYTTTAGLSSANKREKHRLSIETTVSIEWDVPSLSLIHI